ncbi:MULTISPECIES: TetR/AcrR family transcriptional regulator [unclassified Sedimentibacter]|uniref:TetR/AcrR family transcriptional regulator n=1 Tax=unclassified Sedimentibacter TaxID=2649220 RepID=UPI0027E138B5|nr:TetR/AcrR family transcriptional regulator [Sedimentibacter sp. MB35-C1]WMJ76976.1 TetR/AcrR family transcriptional regulator [Sedimentibacter sp. MB35-C1]
MTIEKRREREVEEMKELILSAASDIIASEGFDKLSIRKIAKKIEYSPSIIYHYFDDKEEILNVVMQRGYKKIVSAVSSMKIESSTPEEKLIKMTQNYIKVALSMPEEFMAAQLNQSKVALKHTSLLFEGASKEKPALSALYQCLKEIYKDKDVDENTIELIAQMIVVSTLGLIFKIIIEKDIGDEQRDNLISFYSNEIVLRIANGNTLN